MGGKFGGGGGGRGGGLGSGSHAHASKARRSIVLVVHCPGTVPAVFHCQCKQCWSIASPLGTHTHRQRPEEEGERERETDTKSAAADSWQRERERERERGLCQRMFEYTTHLDLQREKGQY